MDQIEPGNASEYLSALVRMVAFSVDMRSLGRDWLFHVAMIASSTIIVSGSRPSVIRIGVFKSWIKKAACQ